jgi:hypothetical protein
VFFKFIFDYRKQKYNLVKEIRDNYSVEKFFRVQVTNYKIFAALNNLIENQTSEKVTPEITISNKITILEHLTKIPVIAPVDTLLEEYRGYSKDLRVLTYRLLLDKFNDKYDHLSTQQKEVLREVINSIDNTDKLKEYYNTKITEVRDTLKTKIKSTSDKVMQIKLVEVLKYIKPITKTEKVSNDSIIDLLQYYELVNEL